MRELLFHSTIIEKEKKNLTLAIIEGEETPSCRLHAIMGYFQGNYVVSNMFMGQSTYLMKLITRIISLKRIFVVLFLSNTITQRKY